MMSLYFSFQEVRHNCCCIAGHLCYAYLHVISYPYSNNVFNAEQHAILNCITRSYNCLLFMTIQFQHDFAQYTYTRIEIYCTRKHGWFFHRSLVTLIKENVKSNIRRNFAHKIENKKIHFHPSAGKQYSQEAFLCICFIVSIYFTRFLWTP